MPRLQRKRKLPPKHNQNKTCEDVSRPKRINWQLRKRRRKRNAHKLNPTLRAPVSVEHGHVVPGVGWFEDDYLGIDQGPIVLMIENYRSGLIWRLMTQNPALVRGLCRAGFNGGWLEGRC